ncbi:MAG: DUF2087 domain-containing protein [Caulobacteraceae bacterium]
MNDLPEVFWNATLEEVKRGYVYRSDTSEYICLVCGASFFKGIIYQDNNIFYEAEKYTKVHIEKEHSSMFEYLLNLDKKFTGLTEHQKNLLNMFYQGFSDNEIVKKTDVGSTSTIRNHRFTLREKEKQAKVFLSIMELLNEKSAKKQNFINLHRSATMVDERYAITEEENEQTLIKFFKEGLEGPLSDMPVREKSKISVLRHIVRRFDLNRKYTEKEVNEILMRIYHDYATIRRYLIEYGFMDRKNDCSLYWVKV